MNKHRIAIIAGDGIGREVIPAGLSVLRAAAQVCGFEIEAEEFPWGCDYYLRTGRMMDDDGLLRLRDFPAIYLGAIGDPARVPDHISLRDLLIKIRQSFDQYINLRPIKLLAGLQSPLRDKGHSEINLVCVRENSEGEYCGWGGRLKQGQPDEVAEQTVIFTRRGVERVLRYSFDLARQRRKRLASATKSNAMQYTMVMWDDICREVARDYPDVEVTSYHVDALAARFVLQPESLDVVAGSNLFGDILTDLGGALQGSLGIPASANLNPERRFPSLFEPVHGSAPDIAGRGIANPTAAIWAGAMMFEHLDEKDAATLIMNALERALMSGRVRTPDLGGTNSTVEMAEEVIALIKRLPARNGDSTAS
jgi:tartrate dehydrogenase/decarboxylase/D-malate dehydrogenase